MATRFYLPSSGTPPVTPSSWLAWDGTATVAGPFPCGTTPSNTALTSHLSDNIGGSPKKYANARWVSPALAAQTIDGTVKGVIKCMEGSDSHGATVCIGIKVVKPDGTDRGTLLAPAASDASTSRPPEMAVLSAVNTRRLQDAAENTDIILSSVAVTAGDFLVIEMGARATSTNTAHDHTLHYGDPTAGSDFTHADSQTDDFRSWVEFSGSVALYSPSSASPDSDVRQGLGLGLGL